MVNKGKKVLASGVFDLLHLGHKKFLEEAKKVGGPNAQLIVVVARDNIVKQIKGKKPIMSEIQRLALVNSLRVVDKAILGYKEFDVERIIEEVKPDIITVGYDQDAIKKTVNNFLKKKNVPIKVVTLGKFEEGALNSSSKIKRRIIEHYKR